MPHRAQTDGDVSTQRMKSAATRACAALRSSRHIAERLDEALDDITAPHGIRTAGFDEEDSIVTALDEVVKGRRG